MELSYLTKDVELFPYLQCHTSKNKITKEDVNVGGFFLNMIIYKNIINKILVDVNVGGFFLKYNYLKRYNK